MVNALFYVSVVDDLIDELVNHIRYLLFETTTDDLKKSICFRALAKVDAYLNSGASMKLCTLQVALLGRYQPLASHDVIELATYWVAAIARDQVYNLVVELNRDYTKAIIVLASKFEASGECLAVKRELQGASKGEGVRDPA